jgi:hypothetical protein
MKLEKACFWYSIRIISEAVEGIIKKKRYPKYILYCFRAVTGENVLKPAPTYFINFENV